VVVLSPARHEGFDKGLVCFVVTTGTTTIVGVEAAATAEAVAAVGAAEGRAAASSAGRPLSCTSNTHATYNEHCHTSGNG
jgi:hypothetical protein